MSSYTIGVDFGTLSARAVLLELTSGQELAAASFSYPHGVMDTVLAATGAPLPRDFALQDPADYLLALEHVLAELFEKTGILPEQVVGIGVDFTCCTLLPVRADGEPLCFSAEHAADPHAYAKLWKHHAAQKYADRINQLARERGEKWLDRYGGCVSSEWMFPKICEICDNAPEIYDEAAFFIEAGDWINWMLTGRQTRSYVFAAYKSMFLKGEEYPSEDFFAALEPRMRHVVAEKLDAPIVAVGECAGVVDARGAARFGLAAGTMVCAALPDAHAAAPALGVRKNGEMFAILGTSACFMLLGDRLVTVPGICGVAEDGILPDFCGYEAGLCAVGDLFSYAARELTSAQYAHLARSRGISMLALLIEKAAALAPGESGVLALGWFNGNRSTLVNAALSGLFVGITLATRPEHLMRALLEATAFGARNILENYTAHSVQISRIVASGGIARKDPFTMQMYADILGRELQVTATEQGPALGMAIHAAVAAGVFDSVSAACEHLARPIEVVYRPNPQNTPIYDALYRNYRVLHDSFGKENTVMAELRALAEQAKENQK